MHYSTHLYKSHLSKLKLFLQLNTSPLSSTQQVKISTTKEHVIIRIYLMLETLHTQPSILN